MTELWYMPAATWLAKPIEGLPDGRYPSKKLRFAVQDFKGASELNR